MLLLAAFFAWFLVELILLSKANLVRVEGIVTKTEEVKIIKRRGPFFQLRVFLHNADEYFKINGRFRYDRFQQYIHPGDTATIYVLEPWVDNLITASKKDIVSLAVNGIKIFSVPRKPWYEADNFIWIAMMLPLTIGMAFYARREAKKHSK